MQIIAFYILAEAVKTKVSHRQVAKQPFLFAKMA